MVFEVTNIVKFSQRTYSAKIFRVSLSEGPDFVMAGTLDGFIDFATPGGSTYAFTLDEARQLVAALNGAIHDVEENCLYERDALLREKP